jgi:hypothetical protein
MTLADLRKACVDAFVLSRRRDPIMQSLEAMCLAISGALLRAEVWVDGSFLTHKSLFENCSMDDAPPQEAAQGDVDHRLETSIRFS